eukprot:GHVS01103271.1.p1 GENE.GHVS01103271.1~~GHVS01103271.1.p1  ORF type:complete len:108 (-),score=5.17 GHVS01103271.1:91-414(-)
MEVEEEEDAKIAEKEKKDATTLAMSASLQRLSATEEKLCLRFCHVSSHSRTFCFLSCRYLKVGCMNYIPFLEVFPKPSLLLLTKPHLLCYLQSITFGVAERPAQRSC